MKREVFAVVLIVLFAWAGYGEPIGFTARPVVETEFQQQLEQITELSYVYYSAIRFTSGENLVRLSYRFQPSRDSSGVRGSSYYPFTLTPAGLWADGRFGGDHERFLGEVFGVADPERITGAEVGEIPEAFVRGGAAARFEVRLAASGTARDALPDPARRRHLPPDRHPRRGRQLRSQDGTGE